MKDELRKNMDELKEMLFMAERVMKPSPADLHTAAEALHDLFEAYLDAGFERDEALELTKAVMFSGTK